MSTQTGNDGEQQISLASQLVAELVGFAEPILDAAESPDAASALLARIGWKTDALRELVEAVQQATAHVQAALDALHSLADAQDDRSSTGRISLNEFGELLSAARGVSAAIAKLSATNSPNGSSSGLARLGEDLIALLTDDYLRRMHPLLRGVAVLLTLLTPQERAVEQPAVIDTDGRILRSPYRLPALHLDRIGALLRNPEEFLRSAYLPGGALDSPDAVSLFADAIFPLLVDALTNIGIGARYGLDPYFELPFDQSTTRFLQHSIRIWILDSADTDADRVGATLALLGPDATTNGQLAAVVAPLLSTDISFPLRGWMLTLKVGSSGAPFVVVGWTLYPADTASWPGLNLLLTLDAGSLSDSGSSAASAALPSAQLRLEASIHDGLFDTRLSLANRASVSVRADDFADGFLSRIIPQAGIQIPIQLILSGGRSGLKLHGSLTAGNSIVLAAFPSGSVGPLTIQRGRVEVTPTDTRLEVSAQLTFAVSLGPITATVADVGIRYELAWPAGGGSVGPLDLRPHLLWPRGVGISLEAAAVTGGGYLNFDDDRKEYAGIVQLHLGNIALTATGLLTTRLPDGSGGFSLLLLVTSQDFTPIQLGFGFALNGVGGLLGINRTIAIEAMRAGIRNHSLDSILFPPDPVRNASRIVSDIRALFPPAAGRYVFGPMAIVGYGTPPLIEAELAIILELPDPVRLVILGQATLTLPRKGTTIVELHLDVLGIIDFGAKLLSLDATLHDSRISFFNVFGDMALRLSWGADPNFALSIGGLHPRYQPPPGFPELRRVTVALGTGRNPRLTLQGYLAVTSNSVQFGARAELYAEAAGFNLYGWVGFDALFVFSPFSFLTEFTAGLALRRGSSVIASIQVDAALSGPSPWRARGKASISLLFFRLSVGFDATFGSEPRSDPAVDDPWTVLQEEIGKRNNWSAVLPPAATRVVAVIEPPSDGQQAGLLDPVGGLAFHQRRVPLNHPLVRFGQGRLPTPRTFTVQAVTVGDQPIAPTAWQAISDLFAPAQFDELSDADKLTLPSFDRMTAGLSFGAEAIAFGPADAVKGGTLHYTTTVVDGEAAPTPVAATTMTQAQQLLLARHAATVRAPSPTSRSDQVAPDPLASPRVTLAPERYTVVAADDPAERGDVLAAPTTKTAAAATVAGWLAAHPEDRGTLQLAPTYELAAVP